MAIPEVWFEGNDMLALLSGLRSSTMGSTSYLNSSTNVSLNLYDGPTTGSAAVLTNRNLPYLAASNGNYRAVVQSTEATALQLGDSALAVFTVAHLGLNAKWWVPVRVDHRRTS